MENKEFTELLFELTHTKDVEGNDVPFYCFATDLISDTELSESEITTKALTAGYKAFKVFPGETMVGVMVIIPEDGTIEPIKKLYNEFYGEVPSMVELGLDEENKIVELEEVTLEEKKLNKNYLKDIAKAHKKTDKKGAAGWFPGARIHGATLNPNAGNVELNVAHFNNVMGGGTSADGGSGAVGCCESANVELELDDNANYKFDFYLINHFVTMGYDPEKGNIFYPRIPETTMRVSRDGYKTNTLLRKRKNREVLKGVEQFFKDHPKANWCIIGCSDPSRYGKVVNVYRALLEEKELIEDTEKIGSSDYYVVSDGKNPRNSLVFVSGAKDTAIDVAKTKHGYWEVLHYVDGEPTVIWKKGTQEGLEEKILVETPEKHDTLNPKLWDGMKLKPEVEEKINEIVKDFLEGLKDDEIKFNLEDIKLVGSNASYNWNDKSDLDIHLVMDTDSLECPDNLYPLLYSAYRSIYNKNHDIDFYGIPVEIYTETSETEQMSEPEEVTEERKTSALKSNGIYSVMKKEWIKEPVAEDIPELDQEAFDKLLKKWEDRYFDIVGYDSTDIDSVMFEAVSHKSTFVYRGPIFRFNRLVKEQTYIETQAVSLKQAINNIKYRCAAEIGYNRAAGANIGIDTRLVTKLDREEDEDDIETPNIYHKGTCEKCGRWLNDSGQCPLCDLGDESVLEESVEDTKISEIEDYIEDIYDLRKTSIAKEGEYGIGNLVFKEIRNKGYLDNLKELKHQLASRKLSLEEEYKFFLEHLSKEEIAVKVKDITEEKVKSWINKKVGYDMTIDPDTLEKADFENLPSGWICTQNFGLTNLFNPTDYKSMTAFIKKVLSEYGDKYYIGTYRMKYGKYRGKVVIDVNKIIPNTVLAIKDAVNNRQESIYRFDEYLYIIHNLISRKDGKKKDYPLTEEELKEYGLDTVVASGNSEDGEHLRIKLLDKIVDTSIKSSAKN